MRTFTINGQYRLAFPDQGDPSIVWDLRRGRPYEWRLLNVATSLRPRVVVDIGAHIGNHTIRLATTGSRVVAVEPNPDAIRYLELNVADNDLGGRVEVVRAACGASSGTATLDHDEGHMGGVAVEFDRAGPVRVVTLDSLDVSPDLLKVDVEGRELDVLEGGRETLARAHPAVIVESHHDRQGVARFLEPYGYRQVARSLAYSPTWLFVARSEHRHVRAAAWRCSAAGFPRRAASRLVNVVR